MRLVACAGLLSLLVGCDIAASDDLETREIRPSIEALAKSDGTTEIRAQLWKIGSINDVVELSEGDRLVAKYGQASVILSKNDDLFNDISYVGTLEGNAPGSAFVIEFKRSAHDSAGAIATLPEPFQITSPELDENAAISQSVTVKWQGGEPADEMAFDYSAYCGDTTESGGDESADEGQASLAIAQGLDPAPTDCAVDLTVRRRLAGQLSGPWHGEVFGVQEQSVQFGLR